MSDSQVDLGGNFPSPNDPEHVVSSGCEVTASVETDESATPESEAMSHEAAPLGAEPGSSSVANETPVADESAIIDDVQRFSEIEELRQHLDDVRAAISADLEAVARSLGERLSDTANRDETINRLHAEVVEHRRGSHYLMLKPLFNGLIMFYDHLQQAVAKHADNEAVRIEFADFAEELAYILESNDLENFVSTDNQLDRKTQRVVKVETTHEPELDGTVASRLAKGFSYRGEIVVRPEQVVTWKYAPAPES